MNKYLIFAAACLTSFQAAAAEQYMSVRAFGADAKNDADYSFIMNERIGSLSATSAGSLKTNADDDVFGASLAYGIRQGNFRAEIELKMQEDAEKDSLMLGSLMRSKVKNKSAFLNGYYDFRSASKFTPYVGVGIGLSRLEASAGISDGEGIGAMIKEKETKFSWQIGAGVSYAVSQKMAVDLGYRYVDYGEIKGSFPFSETDGSYVADEIDTLKVDSAANEIYIGLRYAF